jgi:hypothetical protein
MISRLRRQPFTIVFAVILGLLVAPAAAIAWHSALSLYDRAFPVVDMSGEVLRVNTEEAVIRIKGKKLRACTYLRVQALMRDDRGDMIDVYIQRVDMAENSDTKPIGSYHLGNWRVWPRNGATGAVINVNHLCGDRLITTKIADVEFARH